MSKSSPTLHLLCGKIASGKSTLAAQLSSREGTISIAEDEWLNALFAEEMSTVADFVRCSAKLKRIVGPHVVALLNAGVSVVLDFHANTREVRDWMRTIIEQTDAAHELHLLDVPDEVCLTRLQARNAQGDHPFAATEAEFRRVSKYFVAPSAEEEFNIIRHSPDTDR